MKTNIEAFNTALAGPHIAIFTHGSVHQNPGPGGYGVALYRMNGSEVTKRAERGGTSPDSTTNNHMELLAVAAGLEAIKPGEPDPIFIRPASHVVAGINQWVPKWVANGWRTADDEPVKNIELWQRIVAATEEKSVHWLLGTSDSDTDARGKLARQIAKKNMREAISVGLFGSAA